MNLYTLLSFHPEEDYYFSVIDKQGHIFDKFQLTECCEIPISNHCIPIKEEFTDPYTLNLGEFLKEYDIYTCYTGGVGDLFSEKAVSALRNELLDEIEFIPCMLRGQPVPVYAALFLKRALIVKDFEGMEFIFENTSLLNMKYAVQDENKGIKLVTQAFVELVKKHNLKIEYQLRSHNKA